MAGISFFIYWFFFLRQPPPPPPPIVLKFCEIENQDIPEVEWAKERCVPPPDITIPPSLIAYDFVKDIEIAESQEIPLRLTDLLNQELELNKTYWLVIKDTVKREVPTFENFLNVFQAKTPEGLFLKLEPAFTLFIYNQEQGKRLGMVVKIKEEEKENFRAQVRFWEDTMENDLAQFFALSGKTGPALKENFGRIAFRGSDIRCQTFGENDFGSCYAIVNNNFIFTLSLESAKKAIEGLRL